MTAESPTKAIDEGLANLGTRYRSAFARAGTEQVLRAEHAKVLGKKRNAAMVAALNTSDCGTALVKKLNGFSNKNGNCPTTLAIKYAAKRGH